tara:strand:- start:1732 stop:2316 length:585 start_codon:yes stop_codon:yes gene_type:complete
MPEIKKPDSCIKVSAEEAKKQMENTTRNELAKLSELIKTQKIPDRRDVLSEEELDTDYTSDYTTDEECMPAKRKRKTTKSVRFQQDVESKMYTDNQILWKKIHKYGIELNRSEKEFRYIQLELNNMTVQRNEYAETCKCIEDYTKHNKNLVKRLNFYKFLHIVHTILLICYAIDYNTRNTFFKYLEKYWGIITI